MKKLSVLLGLAIVLSLGWLVACSSVKKADSSKSAIEAAKALATAQEKVDYLIGQAKTFYNSKEFQGAVDIAQYILQYLDKNSQEAKSLLEKAKDALAAKAKEMVDKTAGDLKNKLGGLGK